MVTKFINSVFNSITYVVNNGEEAFIVDMGDFSPVKEYLETNNLKPKALFITHVHYDHIYGVKEFMKNYPGIPVYTSCLGKESFKNQKWNFSRYHDDVIELESPDIQILKDGDKINPIKGFEIEVMETPGHDHSCLSFIMGKSIFTGDSYIPGIKVVDTFPKSDKKLAKEWYARLEEMKEVYDILPGHPEVK